jgi:hypothetical protein
VSRRNRRCPHGVDRGLYRAPGFAHASVDDLIADRVKVGYGIRCPGDRALTSRRRIHLHFLRELLLELTAYVRSNLRE